MDLIFGSPLSRLKTEVQTHRMKGEWEVILHKLQVFDGNRDASLLFYEGESKVELQCEDLLARQYGQKIDETVPVLSSPLPLEPEKNVDRPSSATSGSDQEVVVDKSKDSGEKLLQIFMTENVSDEDDSLKHLSWIILAKHAYLEGNFETAAVFLHSAELHKFEFVKPHDPRTLRLVAEGIAINGSCAEKFDLPNTPVRSDQERATFAWTCYEIAAALALRCNNATPSDILTTQTAFEAHALFLGPILEKAIRTCLLVGPQDENIQHSLQKYRWCLQTMRLVSSRLLRLQFTRQMVEILASGVESTQEHRDKLIEKLDHLKVQAPHSDNPTPLTTAPFQNSSDEQMLLLEVANNLAAEEMVLNMSSDFTNLRSTALGLALPVLDLATIRALRMNQPDMLESNWARLIPRCYDLPFMVLRYAQAQACNNKYHQAYGTLRNLFRLSEKNLHGHILAAVLCLQHLNDPFQGAQHAGKALSIAEEDSEQNIPLLLLAVALAQQLNLSIIQRTEENMEKVTTLFEEAMQLNRDDYRLFLNKALFEAQCGRLDEASHSIQQCLMINEDCNEGWHLCALILTAVGRSDEALEIMEKYVEEENADMDIFSTHLALLEKMGRWKDALSLAKIVLCKLPVPHDRLLEEDQEIDFLDGPSHVSLSSLPSDRRGEGDYESETLRTQTVIRTDASSAVEVLDETVSLLEADADIAMDMGDNEQLEEAVTTSTVVGSVLSVLQSVTTNLGFSSTASSNEVNKATIVDAKLTEEVDIPPEPGTVPSTGIFASIVGRVTSVFTSTAVEVKAEAEDFKKAVDHWWTPGAVEKQRSLLLAHIASLHVNMGSLSEAEEAVTQAESLHVDTYLLEHVKGLLAVIHGDNVQAKACFELAVLLNPSFVYAWLGLLDVAVQNGNSGLINEYLVQMRQHCADDVETWMLSGQFAMEMEMDKEEEADVYLETAQTLMENRPVRTYRVVDWKVAL